MPLSKKRSAESSNLHVPARRVCLLVETSSSWGRDIIRGIASYSAKVGNWSLDLEFRGRSETIHVPKEWQGNGIIARVTSPELADEILRKGVPAVNVSWYDYGSPGIARCTNNEQKFGQMMAEYLMQRGFRAFAYCGSNRLLRPGYVDKVGNAFAESLIAKGFSCDRYFWPPDEPKGGYRADLAAWLSSLNRPLGVAVWGDYTGRMITEACRLAGLHVPNDVAVISAEYDSLMNSISSPPLTAVDYQAHRVGYEAAALLDRMMAGESAPPGGVLIDPLGVISRQSSDTMACSDPIVAEALRYIAENSGGALRVSQILKQFKISRRALEQRFRKVLSRSIAEEIRRVRLDMAKRMLIDSRDPITAIAAACGFMHPEVLTRCFQREFDVSPTEFRRSHRV
jgi:LacI family transcriptional regulator